MANQGSSLKTYWYRVFVENESVGAGPHDCSWLLSLSFQLYQRSNWYSMSQSPHQDHTVSIDRLAWLMALGIRSSSQEQYSKDLEVIAQEPDLSLECAQFEHLWINYLLLILYCIPGILKINCLSLCLPEKSTLFLKVISMGYRILDLQCFPLYILNVSLISLA